MGACKVGSQFKNQSTTLMAGKTASMSGVFSNQRYKTELWFIYRHLFDTKYIPNISVHVQGLCWSVRMETYACMVVVAVWKVNMFSFGNQLLSSAIRKKKWVQEKAKEKKNPWALLANVATKGKRYKATNSTSTAHSTTPHMERGRHKGCDSRGQTGRKRVRSTPRHIQHQSLRPHQTWEEIDLKTPFPEPNPFFLWQINCKCKV